MLPPNIEDQLTELELRHKRHQIKMEEQTDLKYIRKHRHRGGWHKMKVIPIQLV